VNEKRDRKSGWNTYDEAYLQEVRTKETNMEENRKTTESKRRRQEDEELEVTRRQRDERERRGSKSNARKPPDIVEIVHTADIRTRKQQRYERLDDEKRKQDIKGPNKKRRVVSGPFVEDARAEEVYRRKRSRKKSVGSPGGNPFLRWLKTKRGMCICKYKLDL
jgi:hypothetical protein